MNNYIKYVFLLVATSLYQRFEKKKKLIPPSKIKSPENIKISFVLANPPSADAKALADRQAELLNESPALLQKGWATESMQAPEKSNPRENPKFVLENAAADLKCSQTFEIILPNLIHKSKKRPLR